MSPFLRLSFRPIQVDKIFGQGRCLICGMTCIKTEMMNWMGQR